MNQSLRKQLVMLKCSISNRDYLNQISLSENNLRLDSSELRELQWQKLRELLFFAYDNCPFYYEKYKNAGLEPKEICNFQDFQKVPVLTKSEIREQLDRMVPRDIDSNLLEEVYTSGTTGVPLKIYRDNRTRNLMNALYLRTIRFWGCDAGSRTAWIWGLSNEDERQYDYRYQTRIRRFFKNETWFNAFDVTEENLLEFSRFLNKYRPILIISHVSVLREFADFFRKQGMTIRAPKAIWLTAEPSDPSQRKIIEQSFGAKTYNQYGTSEVLHIAAECRVRSGLHIYADSRYVEIVDSNDKSLPAGEFGNVVVTDLENKVMPLIRYKNGDISSLQSKQCECGVSLPLMDSIAGRVLDMIKLNNGKKIFGHIFASILFRYGEHIRQFQVHQTSSKEIVVRIIPNGTNNFEGIKLEILKEFMKYTKDLIDYSFEFVTHIPRETSGKLRYVKSDV